MSSSPTATTVLMTLPWQTCCPISTTREWGSLAPHLWLWGFSQKRWVGCWWQQLSAAAGKALALKLLPGQLLSSTACATSACCSGIAWPALDNSLLLSVALGLVETVLPDLELVPVLLHSASTMPTLSSCEDLLAHVHMQAPPSWHPAPQELTSACAAASSHASSLGVDISKLALSYSLR
jgi:hypothetical protein